LINGWKRAKLPDRPRRDLRREQHREDMFSLILEADGGSGSACSTQRVHRNYDTRSTMHAPCSVTAIADSPPLDILTDPTSGARWRPSKQESHASRRHDPDANTDRGGRPRLQDAADLPKRTCPRSLTPLDREEVQRANRSRRAGCAAAQDVRGSMAGLG
jgi:hypothetical protein